MWVVLSISRGRRLAPPEGGTPSARAFRPLVEAVLYVGAPISLPSGGMAGC
jgi:hypothetical protein